MHCPKLSSVSGLPAATALLVALLLCETGISQAWQAFPLRENGSIPLWTVAGPFPNGQPYKHGPGCFGYFNDFLTASGGEGHCEPAAGDVVALEEGTEVTWAPAFSDPRGLLDFIDLLGVEKDVPGVVYAFCQVESPVAQAALALVRSNDGVRLWLNGEEVHTLHRGRGVDEGEADRVPLALRAGANNLLVKVDQGAGGWGQLVRLRQPDGGALEGVTAAIKTSKPLRERFWSASLRSTNLVARTPDGPRQMLEAQIVSGGLNDVRCRIVQPGKVPPLTLPVGDLPLGEHRVELLVPELEEDVTARVTFLAASDELPLEAVPLGAPRKWTVEFVQHTHTDIGYTRPQSELLPDFLAQIDTALDYCDATDAFPPEARFKWTCEAAWVVKEYLRRRPPAQIERLRRRVEEGRIEVTGLFLNLLENPDEALMAASLQPVAALREAGLTVTTAMQNDVPGAAWCLTDYLPDIGVKYLVMGVNNDLTPRPFHRPTAFWWESPSGKRLLTWRPDHYHTGNNLRIHLGDRDVFQARLLEYLDSLEELEYPFDRVAAQYSGMQIDNSPPALEGVEMIRRWNEAFEWPRLYSATAGEFPTWVAEHHAGDIETYRGAWPNWWNFGHAFAFIETAEARKAQVALNTTQAMLAMARLLGETLPASVAEDTRLLQEDLLFFDEHTFGAQENFVAPGATNSVVQWGQKIEHIWDAVKTESLLRDTAWAALAPHFARADVPTIAVVNTLPWKRSGVLEIYVGHDLAHPEDAPRFIDAARGTEVPAEVVRSRFEGSYWRLWVEDVPPLGGKVLHIEPGGATETPPPSPPSSTTSNTLENAYYRVEVNPETGAIQSLYDKALEGEFVASNRPWDLGQIVIDRLSDEHFSDHASYRERSTISTVRNVRVTPGPESPLWQSLHIAAEHDHFIASEEVPGVALEIRLYTHEKQIELHFTMHRNYIDAPNTLYVAFPFAPKDGTFAYEAQGGVVTPGVDQLPGSSTDWHTAQNFLALRGEGAQLVLSSKEIPLVQFGDINIGKWQYQAEVAQPHVYSWVFDDYWTYGFPGNKESVFSWSYQITTAPGTGDSFATHFGQAARTPFAAKVFPPAKGKGEKHTWSTLGGIPETVGLVGFRPEAKGRGVTLQVRELAGEATSITLRGMLDDWTFPTPVNAIGTSIGDPGDFVLLAPHGSAFVSISPDTE